MDDTVSSKFAYLKTNGAEPNYCTLFRFSHGKEVSLCVTLVE